MPELHFNIEGAEAVAHAAAPLIALKLRVGDRVRLWPQKRADILDVAVAGKVAIIEAIEMDFDDQVHFAVVLDDDPGREFGMMRQPGHRFFYSPEEVEPVGEVVVEPVDERGEA
ncbi:MAG: hypothetical protein ACYCSN_04215 [Acidobacteriaceae bacterium]